MASLVQAVQSFAQYDAQFNPSHTLVKNVKEAKKTFQTAFLILSSHQSESERANFISQLEGKAQTKAIDWCKPKFDEKRKELSNQTASESSVKDKSVDFNKARNALYADKDWKSFREDRKFVRETTISLLNSGTPFEQISDDFKAAKIPDAIIQKVKEVAEKYRNRSKT